MSHDRFFHPSFPRAGEVIDDDSMHYMLGSLQADTPDAVCFVITETGRIGKAIAVVKDTGTTHPIAVLDTLARTLPLDTTCHTLFGGEILSADGVKETSP